MKSDKTSKFKVGQTVFVALDERACEAKIASIVTYSEKEVCENGSVITSSRTYYKCHGNFIFKSGGKSCYAYRREFEEDVIFETKEQAEEYIIKNIDKIIKDLVTKIIHLCGPITYKTKKDVISAENYNIVKLTRQYLKELRKLANR